MFPDVFWRGYQIKAFMGPDPVVDSFSLRHCRRASRGGAPPTRRVNSMRPLRTACRQHQDEQRLERRSGIRLPRLELEIF